MLAAAILLLAASSANITTANIDQISKDTWAKAEPAARKALESLKAMIADPTMNHRSRLQALRKQSHATLGRPVTVLEYRVIR